MFCDYVKIMSDPHVKGVDDDWARAKKCKCIATTVVS